MARVRKAVVNGRDGSGSGYGHGCGAGYGHGCDAGWGHGCDAGVGHGDGSGHGESNGYYSSGDGDGYCPGSVFGDGTGDGAGHGYGHGYGAGAGSGYGEGDGGGLIPTRYGDIVTIGCKSMTIDAWLGPQGAEVAKRNNVSESNQEDYRALLESWR